MRKLYLAFISLAFIFSGVLACSSSTPTSTFTLTITAGGAGTGTVSSDSGGISCNNTGGTCTADFNSGTVVTLTATPATGYVFQAWSGGGCEGVGTCTVTMNQATSIRATFIMIVFSSTRNLDESNDGAASSINNLWLIKADGTDLSPLTQITTTSVDSSDSQWSPDGTQIVFRSDLNLDGSNTGTINPSRNIWVINADGTGLTALTQVTASSASSNYPQWSPDGTQIIFESTRNLDGSNAGTANAANNIWIINSDGTGLTALTQVTAASASSYAPQWSPDGTQILFYSYRNLDGSNNGTANVALNVWKINSDGTGLTALTQVTATSGDNNNPQWSPDGTQIIFTSARNLDGSNTGTANAASNVWKINSDGTGLTALTQVTATGAGSSDPQWSPDGMQVIFSSRRNLDGSNNGTANTVSNVWVMNADGTGLTALTQSTATGTDTNSPQWSPDGTQIIFISARNLDGSNTGTANAASNVWKINSDGTGITALTQVTATFATSTSPQW